ncbi:hypothetical protein QTP70_006554 [Hemibagrus guttatus]|uniref:ribonuclease H n=1 Tax=Hemibagrus guttatus TaxID=175788 RepID=A0AAE0PR76_9TELE|nr:hypothetical protein QTP70_006554 [Hemibagrus guttatus]
MEQKETEVSEKGVPSSTSGVVVQVREKKGALRAAIPYMPFPVAVMCLFFNTFIPGLGTFISAFTVLCGARTDLPDRHVCCVFWLNIAAAFIQIITAVVMVGWIMSIFWGMDMVILATLDLEKAYDRVPREELWYWMRKSGVAEKYVRVVQDMYERSRTVVRCAVGQTEEFKVEVGLHQGSALSPFLFAIVMDQLSEEVRQESPWTMMFADDIVICSESREQVEENLERWRFALERRGMKVSGSKTEYMCVNEMEGSGTVRLQGEEVKKVQEFKYLGSTVQSNGECGKEVKKRVQAGWNGWRKVWGVLCERKISARIKGKVYRTVVRAAMLYGLETVSLRKRQESELEVAELKMLRLSLGVTRLDRIRNGCV